jgi:hypothetical protein
VFEDVRIIDFQLTTSSIYPRSDDITKSIYERGFLLDNQQLELLLLIYCFDVCKRRCQ